MKALVTGANGDIGYAIADYFLAKKYHLYVTDKVCSKYSYSSAALSIHCADFTVNASMNSLLAALDEPVDVLVYAAGVREICPVLNLSVAEWQDVMTINLTSAFILSQHMIKLAVQYHRSLNIIFISSISGLQGESERNAYCASKHGLIGLAKSLAIELAQYAIRVNVIAPGIIDTAMTQSYHSLPRVMEQLNRHIPLARWGVPQHIVQSVDYILNNDYVTGSTLVVDGGWMAGEGNLGCRLANDFISGLVKDKELVDRAVFVAHINAVLDNRDMSVRKPRKILLQKLIAK